MSGGKAQEAGKFKRQRCSLQRFIAVINCGGDFSSQTQAFLYDACTLTRSAAPKRFHDPSICALYKGSTGDSREGPVVLQL